MENQTVPFTKDDVRRIARQIYEENIKVNVEPVHLGKFIVIDIETGEYDIGEDDVSVSSNMRQRKPSGVRYGMWIGKGVAGKFRSAL